MPLSIVAAKGLYMLDGCTFALKELPQRAGFRWHDPGKCKLAPCPACLALMPAKKWWTDSESTVARLLVVCRKAGEPLDLSGDPDVEARVVAIAGRPAPPQRDWFAELDYRGDDRGEE